MKTAMILLCLVAAASAKPSRFFPVPHVGIATGFSDANSAQAQKSNIFGTTQVQQSAVNAGGFAANGGASLNDASSTLSQSIGPGGAHQFTHNQANSNQFGGFGF